MKESMNSPTEESKSRPAGSIGFAGTHPSRTRPTRWEESSSKSETAVRSPINIATYNM